MAKETYDPKLPYEMRRNGVAVMASSVPDCGYTASQLKSMKQCGYTLYFEGKPVKKQ